MKTINNTLEFIGLREKISCSKTIGFVPTMGCLHKGHSSLIKKAKEDNDLVVLSIFINPTQFNNSDDYNNYPNNLEKDLELATNLGVDYVFLPNINCIYPNGYIFNIEPSHPTIKKFEGEYRPGHFKGMLTIVMKMLLIVKPSQTYFGEKDYQQAILVESLIKDFFLNIKCHICPTIRTSSGLPYSSRNARLSSTQRDKANNVYAMIKKINKKNITEIKNKLEQQNINIDYLEINNDRLFLAFYIDNIRLIDNFLLEKNHVY